MKNFWRFFSVCILAGLASSAPAKTNIIYILCDDLGYGDLKCLNPLGKIATPRMDALAAAGMVFTDMHSGSAVCSPTRYGLMTGRYSWRSKLQSGVLGGLSPRLIEPGRLTVAEFLKKSGYRTACIGKWHLGMDWVLKPGKQITELNIETPGQVWNVDFSKPFANGPTTVGFESYYGIASSLDMVPYTFLENDRCTVVPTVDKQFELMLGRPGLTRLGPAAADFHAEQVLPTLTRKAISFIETCSADAKKGKPFFLYLPLASPHTPILPTKEWQGKSGLNPFADFVMQTDDCIGKILDALDGQGLKDDTLVIVTSDNGCSPQAKFPELLAKGHNPSHIFRGTKADIHEGGHRVPFIARWPGKIQAGSRCTGVFCLVDFMATAAEIVGSALPAEAGEDSVSMMRALVNGSDGNYREAVVHHSINGSFAIRQGDWKLDLCPGSGGWSAPRPGKQDTSKLPLVQLYNLKEDIGEKTNLQAKHPDIVTRMTLLLEEFVKRGRSTPGKDQPNTVQPDIWKAGKAAHQPIK